MSHQRSFNYLHPCGKKSDFHWHWLYVALPIIVFSIVYHVSINFFVGILSKQFIRNKCVNRKTQFLTSMTPHYTAYHNISLHTTRHMIIRLCFKASDIYITVFALCIFTMGFHAMHLKWNVNRLECVLNPWMRFPVLSSLSNMLPIYRTYTCGYLTQKIFLRHGQQYILIIWKLNQVDALDDWFKISLM